MPVHCPGSRGSLLVILVYIYVHVYVLGGKCVMFSLVGTSCMEQCQEISSTM